MPVNPGILAGPRPGVEALAIALLADLQGRGHVDEHERRPGALDHVAHLAPRLVVRGDRCAEGDPAVPADLGGHETDPAHVEHAVLAAETELGGQHPADDVAVEDGDRAVAAFDETLGEPRGDRRLPGARQPGHHHRQPGTDGPRGPAHLARHPRIRGVGRGDVAPCVERGDGGRSRDVGGAVGGEDVPHEFRVGLLRALARHRDRDDGGVESRAHGEAGAHQRRRVHAPAPPGPGEREEHHVRLEPVRARSDARDLGRGDGAVDGDAQGRQ